MAVLWFSNETPSRDGQGGQRRQFFLIQSLVRDGHEVCVVSLEGPQDGRSLVGLATLLRVPALGRRPRGLLRWARLLVRVARQHWDAVVVSHSESWHAGSVLAWAAGAPVFVDLHNVNSAWYRSRGELEAERQQDAVERSILQRATVVAVCAPREGASLPVITDGGQIVVMEHGIDPDEWREASCPGPGAVVKLFGNWWWGPNRSGLRWFLTEVWPPLSDAMPGVRCEIAGDGVDLEPSAGVAVLGRVPSIPKFLVDATVVAVPVVGGRGAPVKYAEALASGVPVAATLDGAHGLSLHGGLVSDVPGEWVDWIGRAALDREVRAAATRTRECVLTEYTWYERSAPLRDWVSAVSGRRS